jgi:LEA14-like dessication related protein
MTAMMRTLVSLLSLSLLLVLAGCGTPPEQRLDAPAIQVTALTSAADSYVVTLRLVNPNTVPMVVASSTHMLYLGEQKIGRIDDREPIGVPPLGEVTHTVKLPSKLSTVARAWLASHSGDVRVVTESTLEITVGTDNDTLTLKSAGRGVVKAP